ncbi:MAG: hypothetical protein E7016_05655 [Alphaproteobacteria bacterium]|nr:hypothetical protein [Alphaproteobacteria bacterium]
MKNYVAKISYETEWDIMKMAVHNGNLEAVCAMLKDGYQLSLELLELLYRIRGESAVIKAVESSNEDLSDGEHEDILMFLSENLKEEVCDAVIKNNAKRLEVLEQEREQAHKEMIEKEFLRIEKCCGAHSRAFYQEISSAGEVHEELIELTIERYTKQSVCDDLFEHKLLSFVEFSGNIFRPETRYENWLKYFDVEYLLKIGQLYAAAYCVSNYFKSVEDAFKVANAGGLKYFLTTNSYYLFDLFEDKQMREKAKGFGSIGYQRVYQCAKKHFTLDDWYKWYELDPKAAIKRAHKLNVPRLWLLQHGYLKKAIFRK